MQDLANSFQEILADDAIELQLANVARAHYVIKCGNLA